MEERLIDEEYGRGVRLKKTEDGYVDVTDELEEEGETQAAEEALFEFPELEEDDEELATLTPEQAAELKRQRAEAMKLREMEYQKTVEEAQAILQSGEFEQAEKLFEKAINLLPDHEDASVGYLRAITQDFADPDAMIEEYEEEFDDADEAYEEFVYVHGKNAVDGISKQHADAFKARVAELEELAAPIEGKVLEKQQKRRAQIKARLKKQLITLLCVAVPTILLLVATVVLATMIHSRPDRLFLYLTVAFAAVTAVVFFVCVWAGNKFLNTLRMKNRNEDLRSTEEGADLAELHFYRDFYNLLIG